MSGTVYILTNLAMPDYIKIGFTTNLDQRLRQLDNTSTPLPFEVFYAANVADMVTAEKLLHEAFADKRVRSNREFFEVSPDQAAATLRYLVQLTGGEDIVEGENCETQEDCLALEKARKKRSAFSFAMVGIPVGSELSWYKDETITCKVLPGNKVEFEGLETSVSAAAQGLLESKWGVQGTLYWKYEGETLDGRRKRLEEEE